MLQSNFNFFIRGESNLFPGHRQLTLFCKQSIMTTTFTTFSAYLFLPILSGIFPSFTSHMNGLILFFFLLFIRELNQKKDFGLSTVDIDFANKMKRIQLARADQVRACFSISPRRWLLVFSVILRKELSSTDQVSGGSKIAWTHH